MKRRETDAAVESRGETTERGDAVMEIRLNLHKTWASTIPPGERKKPPRQKGGFELILYERI